MNMTKKTYFRRDGTPCPEEEAVTNGVLQDGYSMRNPMMADGAPRPSQRMYFADSSTATMTFDQAIADVSPGHDSGIRAIVNDLRSTEVFRVQSAIQSARSRAGMLHSQACHGGYWSDRERKAAHDLSIHLNRMADEADARVAEMLGGTPRDLAYDQMCADINDAWKTDAHRPPQNREAALGDAQTEYERMKRRAEDAWKGGR